MTVTPLVVMFPVTELFALSLSVKVAAVTVAGFTGLLKVAVRAEKIDTLVAPLGGAVWLTVGAIVDARVPVVKDQVYGAANALPERPLTPLVRVAV